MRIAFTFVNYSLVTFVNMEESTLQKKLADGFYEAVRNGNISGRYFNYSHLEEALNNLPSDTKIETIGYSVKEEPIKLLKLGTGKIKVLAWSQMHGNETTTTKAVLDLISAFIYQPDDLLSGQILKNCSIYFVLMLNPDGARAYTRENANGIDLNRDMQELSQPESKTLHAQFNHIKPHYCLNLHDQRTIFSSGTKDKSAILSFLAPAADEARSINQSRRIAMGLIAGIKSHLGDELPEQIGRYDDSFNINCAGETFQSLGIPTLLFEAGHFPNDYEREKTRKFIFKALLVFFFQITSEESLDAMHKDYFEIPENKKLFNDIILREALIDGFLKDISIQFKEVLKDGKIDFVPTVAKIAPKISNFGHKEIDCEGKELKFLDKEHISENDIVNKLILNNKELMLKPA